MGYNINRHSALDHAVDLAKEGLISHGQIVEAAEAFHAFLAPKKAKANPAVFEASDNEDEPLADPDEYLYFVWGSDKDSESVYRVQRRNLGSEADSTDAAYANGDGTYEIMPGYLKGRFPVANGLTPLDLDEVPKDFRADLIKADAFGYTHEQSRDPGGPHTWLLLEDGRVAFVDGADDPDLYCLSSYEDYQLRDILNGNPKPSYGPKHLGVTYVPRDLVIANHY